MEFKKVIQDIQNKNARKRGVKAYYDSGKVFFSRLWAYERVAENYLPIPKYADAIKLIVQMLIDGKSLPEIKQKLDCEGYRDASNNRMSFNRIESAVRPIYAGYLRKGFAYNRIENVEPIVSLAEYKMAKKNLERELRKMIEIHD